MEGGPKMEVYCGSVEPEADSDFSSMGIEEPCCDGAVEDSCVGEVGRSEVGTSVLGPGVSADAMLNSRKIPGTPILKISMYIRKAQWSAVEGLRGRCVILRICFRTRRQTCRGIKLGL